MNPNQFQWLPNHSSSSPSSSNSSLNYQTLEQQLTNLTLSHNPWSISQRPTNHYNYNDNEVNNNNNNNNNNTNSYYYNNSSTTFPPSAHRPSNSRVVPGPTAQDYHANDVALLRRLRAEEQYLAMLHLLHNNNNNNNSSTPNSVSGLRARSRNTITRRSNNTSESNYIGVIHWDDIKGNVALYATDHQRCKILQQMLETSINDYEIVDTIISEIKDDLSKVVVNHIGGQFFQSLLEYCNDEDVTQFLRAAMITQQRFVDICLDNHGSRAMQKLIRKINVTNGEQKSMILSMMKKVMLTLITNMNSYYFVTELFSSLKRPAGYDLITRLFDEIGDHILEIAMDKFGCCALHICLEHGHRCPQRDRILKLIISHAVELAQNDYGNYVIQYIISKPQEQLLDGIVRKLLGKFAYFCMNKYACHVVEKCIMYGTNEHLESIVREILDDSNFLQILLHQTGNYVVQTAITRCNEASSSSSRLSSLFNKLTDGVIRYEYPFLRYDRLGKHVLLCAKTEKERNNRRRMLHY